MSTIDKLNHVSKDKISINSSELSFTITITDYNSPIYEEDEDSELIEYDVYKVTLNDELTLKKRDISNLVKSLKIANDRYTRYDSSLIPEEILIYYKDNYVGKVTCYLIDKVKNIPNFISDTEYHSGCAGVVACEIVSNNLFTSLIKNRRFVYIEWIHLKDEYKTIENEGIVLEKILSYLKSNYKVKRVFARPVAIDLTEDESKYMRCKYHRIESLFYNMYGHYMCGYVKSYYKDVPGHIKYLCNLSDEKKIEIKKGYEYKLSNMQDTYKSKGMSLLGNISSGVMYIEF